MLLFEIQLQNLDKVQGIVVNLRKDKTKEQSRNTLIAMLEELLKSDSPENKKEKLKEYGIVMNTELEGRVKEMCNLSDIVFEEGIELGKEQGIELGKEQGIELGKEQGIELGKEQGIELGKEQGIELGEKKNLIFLVRRKIEKNKSLEQSADELEIPATELEAIYTVVSENMDKTDTEIVYILRDRKN